VTLHSEREREGRHRGAAVAHGIRHYRGGERDRERECVRERARERDRERERGSTVARPSLAAYAIIGVPVRTLPPPGCAGPPAPRLFAGEV